MTQRVESATDRSAVTQRAARWHNNIRVTADERELLRQTAARSGQDVSSLVRALAEAEAARLERLEARAKH